MNEELKLTEALLDIGVSVPLRTLRIKRWKWTPRVTVKRPPLGGLLRLLRVWLSLGVTPDQIDTMTEPEREQFLVRHGAEISKFVALCVCSGYFSGRIIAPVLRRFLMWRCHPDVLLYTVSVFMNLQDTKSFMTIIKSGAAINIAVPRLSREERS